MSTSPHHHGPNCGHLAVRHGDHVDYLAQGHLAHPHGDHDDDHVIEVSDRMTAAHQTIAAQGTHLITCMGPDAVTKQCRMVITLTTWSTVTCIIRMATTAMITVRWNSQNLSAGRQSRADTRL